MARCKSITKEGMVATLENLTDAVKNADKIEEFTFCSVNEVEEIPVSNDKVEKMPTGWTKVNFNIYFKNSASENTWLIDNSTDPMQDVLDMKKKLEKKEGYLPAPLCNICGARLVRIKIGDMLKYECPNTVSHMIAGRNKKEKKMKDLKSEGEFLERILIDRGIVKKGHWKLTSGRHSDTYIFKDALMIDSTRHMFVSGLVTPKDLKDIGVVTGPAMAGAMFAAMIARKHDIPFIYPDRLAQFRDVFKGFLKGKKVLLVEDIVTTGGSIDKVIKAVADCGGEVLRVHVIWNRSGYIPTDLYGKPIKTFNMIETKIESWERRGCPLCDEDIFPLKDPKTGLIVEE